MSVTLWWIPALGYLIGSIPTGYWLGKTWKGIDVRQQGSGNLGATNVFRVLGKGPGIVTLVIDILKGALPVLWVKQCYPEALGLAVATGVAAILGHMTSIFVHFRGGKGVATSAGVFAALLPIPSAISIGVFVICFSITRIVSISSILSAITLAAAAFFLSPSPLLYGTAIVVASLVVLTHRANIRRLIAGTELRVGSKGRS